MSRDRDRRNIDRGRSPPVVESHTSSRDPTLLLSRVFIGNLPTDLMVRSDLEELFAEYGNIMGCSLHKGFGFVQYGKEADGRKAVNAVNGKLFKGYRLDVKMAAEGRKDKKSSSPPRGGRGDERMPPARDRSPQREKRDPYRYEDPYRRPIGAERRPPPERDPCDRFYDDTYGRDPYYDAPPPPQAPYGTPPFDCTIVAATKLQRPYCELIERRLKASGMLIDLIILTEESALPQAMDDIQRDKIPYAIICTAQNEAHRSLTLNILHGTPQEHRNMPLDDAIVLVARNFEKYLEEMRAKPAPSIGSGGRQSVDFVPPDQHLGYLLNLLADGRQVTLEEMEQVFTYVKTRRNRLLEARGLPTDEGKKVNSVADPQEKNIIEHQAHLQAKILSILQGSGGIANPAPAVPAPQAQPRLPPKPAASGGINFDNPSVQRALDNLIQSGPNLLRNINQGGSNNGTSRGSEGAYGGFDEQANSGYGQGPYRY